MIGKIKIFENFRFLILLLLFFFIPTQLVYHFWPEWSFVFGLRIDYLAVRIYFTDLLIILYLLFFTFGKKPKNILNKKNTVFVITFLFLSIVNIVFSYKKEITLFKWIKVFEMVLLFYAVCREKLVKKDVVIKTLCFSVLTFSLISFVQIIKGSTLGGLFYFLGERSFDTTTPGISLLYIFNKTLLRSYSTFSHPNSFAGYLLVSSILIYFWKVSKNGNIILKKITLFVSLLTIFFCFSKSVFLSLFFIFFFLSSKTKCLTSVTKRTFYFIFFLSMLMPIISAYVLENDLFLPQNVNDRFMLSRAAGKMFSLFPISGIGLNNFISFLPTINILKLPFWFLQPVHNIFLLILSETGLLGMFVFFVLIEKLIDSLKEIGLKEFSIVIIAFLITGFFDHYWLTLQQNMVLLSLVLGLSKNKQFK